MLSLSLYFIFYIITFNKFLISFFFNFYLYVLCFTFNSTVNILEQFVDNELYLGIPQYFNTTHDDCVWRYPFKDRILCTKEVKIWLNSNGIEEAVRVFCINRQTNKQTNTNINIHNVRSWEKERDRKSVRDKIFFCTHFC